MAVPRPTSSSSTRLDGVAVFKMAATSVISTRNVDRPRARLSAAPMRVKIRSRHREPRLAGRNERTHLGHQNDQRGLPEIRGLPAHVGSGDQQNLLRSVIQVKIVGHKSLALLFQQLLDHGMAARDDHDLAVIAKLRPRVIS